MTKLGMLSLSFGPYSGVHRGTLRGTGARSRTGVAPRVRSLRHAAASLPGVRGRPPLIADPPADIPALEPEQATRKIATTPKIAERLNSLTLPSRSARA